MEEKKKKADLFFNSFFIKFSFRFLQLYQIIRKTVNKIKSNMT